MTGVLYVVNDKLGGVLSLNSNLLRFRQPDALAHDVLLVHNRLDVDTRWARPVGGDREWTFEYALPVENLFAVLKRLRAMVPKDDGVLVANDWLELALATEFDLGRSVYLIVHDEYHLELAVRHEPVVDAFICHSRDIHRRVAQALPARVASVHYLPYGIPIPLDERQPSPGPLRLLFIGRMTANKGIFDLPAIDEKLAGAGVPVRWTLAGDGPDREKLRRGWNRGHVAFVAPSTNEDLLALACHHDVFVLPTRFEGFPVSLLEAMSVGLVPVVTNLPGGISEIVHENETGYRPEAGDVDGFARSIMELDADRERLSRMGAACRALVREEFDVRDRVKGYQALFSRWRELRRHRPDNLVLPYGSRLDKRWIPNTVVRIFRYGSRCLRGKPAIW